MTKIIPLTSGRGLNFSDFLADYTIDDDDNVTFRFSQEEPKPGTLVLVVQDNGTVFPGICYSGRGMVNVCGRFQIAGDEDWIDIDLTSLPHKADEIKDEIILKVVGK